MRSRQRGSVTVFAALSFMLIVSLITVMVESVRIEGARVMVSGATTMALDSMLAGFETELLDDYGILLFDGGYGEDCIDYLQMENDIEETISYITQPSKGLILTSGMDFYNISIDEVKINQVVTPMDAGGMMFRKMVTDYEKYDYPAELFELLLEIDTLDDKNRAIRAIADKMDEGFDLVAAFNQSYLELIEHLDGISTSSSGINWQHAKPTSRSVKKFSTVPNNDITKSTISINDDRAYNISAPSALAVHAVLQSCMDSLKKVSDGDIAYIPNAKAQSEYINAFFWDEKNENIICKELIQSMEDSSGKIDIAISIVSGMIDVFPYESEYVDGLKEDLQQLKDNNNKVIERLEYLKPMIDTFNSNILVLDSIMSHCRNIKEMKNDAKSKEEAIIALSEYKAAYELVSGYKTVDMYLDYSGLECRDGDESLLGCIKSIATDGILGLVIPDDSKISTKSIGNLSLADLYGSYEDRSQYIEDKALDITNEIIFSLYITDTYECFTKTDNKGLLDYEQEFILFGENNDRENLKKSILAISGIRLSANIATIFTDSTRKNEAYSLALATLGFTGMMPLIKGLEYTILLAWAVGETVVDLKILMDGGKVPLYKTKDDWNLSLENLSKGRFESSKDNHESGLSYSNYLACVMMLSNSQTKAYRSMSVIEMNMIAAGVNKFKIKNYIYGLNVTVTYHLGNGKKQYKETCSYTY